MITPIPSVHLIKKVLSISKYIMLPSLYFSTFESSWALTIPLAKANILSPVRCNDPKGIWSILSYLVWYT